MWQSTIHIHVISRFICFLKTGTKDDVINLKEQFVEGIYTPEFLNDSTGTEESALSACENVTPEKTKGETKGTLIKVFII